MRVKHWKMICQFLRQAKMLLVIHRHVPDARCSSKKFYAHLPDCPQIIFEWITRRMETVEIPAYVFEAFGLKPEQRCFRLEDALFTDESSGFTSRRDDPAKDGGIPDLSRQEARLWFY